MLALHTTVAQTRYCSWPGATSVWTYQSNPLSAGPRRSLHFAAAHLLSNIRQFGTVVPTLSNE